MNEGVRVGSDQVFMVGLVLGLLFGGFVGFLAGLGVEDALDIVNFRNRQRGKRSHQKKEKP